MRWQELERKQEQGTPLSQDELKEAYRSLDWFYGSGIVFCMFFAVIIIMLSCLGR